MGGGLAILLGLYFFAISQLGLIALGYLLRKWIAPYDAREPMVEEVIPRIGGFMVGPDEEYEEEEEV